MYSQFEGLGEKGRHDVVTEMYSKQAAGKKKHTKLAFHSILKLFTGTSRTTMGLTLVNVSSYYTDK